MSENWRKQAACAEAEDFESFFPPPSAQNHDRQVKEAKAFCADCPVVTHCLAEALEDPFTHGIWGNTTELERKKMKRSGRRRSVASVAIEYAAY